MTVNAEAWIDRLLDLGLPVDAAAWQVGPVMSRQVIHEDVGSGPIVARSGNSRGHGDYEYCEWSAYTGYAGYGDGYGTGHGDGFIASTRHARDADQIRAING